MASNNWRFAEWLDTFVAEKGFDPEQLFEIDGPSGTNFMPLGIIIEAMKETSHGEQSQIRKTLVQIDYLNGDCLDFFKHLGKALAI